MAYLIDLSQYACYYSIHVASRCIRSIADASSLVLLGRTATRNRRVCSKELSFSKDYCSVGPLNISLLLNQNAKPHSSLALPTS